MALRTFSPPLLHICPPVKELEEGEQLLWVEVALVETMMGMALYLPVDDHFCCFTSPLEGIPHGCPSPTQLESERWGGRWVDGLRNTGGSHTLSVFPPLPRTRSHPCTGRRISAACCGWAGSTGARSPRDIPLWALWRPWHMMHNLSGGGSPLGPPPPGTGSLQRVGEARSGHEWYRRWARVHTWAGCWETCV